MRLLRTHSNDKYFYSLPTPTTADTTYIAFLDEQANSTKWSLRFRGQAFRWLFALDETKYRKPYRDFLLGHLKTTEDWWIRGYVLYAGLIELNDEASLKAVREGLIHDPVTDCREAILYHLKEQGEVASVIDAILVVLNKQDDKHQGMSLQRMPFGWSYHLNEYLTWAKSLKTLDASTARKVDDALAKLTKEPWN